MGKSGERSEASYSTSQAEQMAEAAYKAYYSKIMCKGSLPSHAEISINFYLAGMKALLAEAEKMAYAGTDWMDDKVILVVDLSDLQKIMGKDDQA